MDVWVLTELGNLRAVPEDIAVTLAMDPGPEYQKCVFFFANLAPVEI